MVEDDTFTYHVKQLSTDQTNTAVHSLITKERTQKLDLLIHLLSNLAQSLVVCGPQGIGKTTLLTLLQQRNTESWRYYVVQGNADLSFEAIQEQLARTFAGKSVQSSSDVLGQYQGQHKQVVLIVDNAGELVPGLISAIIHYAAANPVLRVIFALTHDELQVKRGSDRAIDDCHIIEIPTLSEKQCGDFLQHLSTKPALNLPFKAISENMIAHIYRETHGVPGRIIAELLDLPDAKQGRKWVLALALVGAIAIAFGVQWLATKNVTKKTIAPVAVKQKTDAIEIALPRSESTTMISLPPAQPIIQQRALSGAAEAPVNGVKDTLGPSVEADASAIPMPLEAPQEQPRQSLSPSSEVEPQTAPVLKIKAQSDPMSVARPEQKTEQSTASSANNFTLQLMVLSKQASVNGILKKYPSITPGIRTIKTEANGQEKFILEYGSYSDAVSANKARQSLPTEFRNAMVKKIK